METQGTFSIGKAARAAGVRVVTLRYYERRGLIPKLERSLSGYRLFSFKTVRRVRFIRRAQELGFTLKEILRLLSLADGDVTGCGEVRDFTLEKIKDIEARLARLESLKRVLSRLAKQCAGKGPVKDCPIVESLDGEPPLKASLNKNPSKTF